MKILVVHHGAPKSDGGPVTGSALRAHQLSSGLIYNGHTVKLLTRAQDKSNGFIDPQDLLSKATAYSPDIIICIQLEDAPILAALNVPLIVDLYAMRLLEAPFAGQIGDTVLATLAALSVGDKFLVSNQRQQWAWLGVLAMSGIDLKEDPTLLVPLSTHKVQSESKHDSFTVIGGGHWWPWQNPWEQMALLLNAMDKHDYGRIHWYGSGDSKSPINHPRLQLKGWVSHDQFLSELTKGHVAFDAYDRHPERDMAISFRQMDYLSAGLPIASLSGNPMQEMIKNTGWIVDDWNETLISWKNNPGTITAKSDATKSAANSFSIERSTQSLIDWLPQATVSAKSQSPLLQLGIDSHRLKSVNQKNKALQHQIETLNQDITKKNEEIQKCHEQIDKLTAAVDRLSRAIDEVAGFKREATAILGARVESHANQAESLQRENAILRADIEKKTAELEAMDNLRQRLENDLRNLREALNQSRSAKKRFF